jgi:hypothetical protein
MVSHGHDDAQILMWPHSFLKLRTDRHPHQERLCTLYTSDTQLVICSNGPSIWSDRFRGPWIGIMCVCVCVCARAHMRMSLESFFPVSAHPTKCTRSEIYQPQITKHKVPRVRSVTAAYYKLLTSCNSSFLTLALQQMNGQHQPWLLYPPSTYWTGGWVGSRASVEMMVRSSTPTRNFTIQPTA